MSEHWKPYVQAALAAVQDQALSPQEAANQIVEQCDQCVLGASGDAAAVTQEGDTPGLEDFLWCFWAPFLQFAKDNASMHDRLARILDALKAKGDQGCDAWCIWGEPLTQGGRLTGFGIASREEMNGPDEHLEGMAPLDTSTPRAQSVLSGDPPSDDPIERKLAQSRQQWLNINAFLAKIWALDIVDEHFFAIAAMRMYLEPLSLQSTGGPTAGAVNHETDHPQELQIEVAAVWVKFAGAQMYTCREILGPKGNPNWLLNRGCPGGSGGTWDGVDGYHPDRWVHWKKIFSEVAQGNWRKNVIDAAQAAVEAMEKSERSAASA